MQSSMRVVAISQSGTESTDYLLQISPPFPIWKQNSHFIVFNLYLHTKTNSQKNLVSCTCILEKPSPAMDIKSYSNICIGTLHLQNGIDSRVIPELN